MLVVAAAAELNELWEEKRRKCVAREAVGKAGGRCPLRATRPALCGTRRAMVRKSAGWCLILSLLAIA